MNSSGQEQNRMEGLRMKGLRYRNSRHILCQRDKYRLVEGIGLILREEKLKKKNKSNTENLEWCYTCSVVNPQEHIL
jgi:hypothetical protein